MSGQTPGPWKLIADPYEDGTPYFRFEAGEVFDETDERCGFRIDGIMREPDARLIAAAPYLLMALKFIAEFHGKTLIAPSLGTDADRGHQIGANKAFEQAAEIALDALRWLETDLKMENPNAARVVGGPQTEAVKRISEAGA